MKTMNYKKWSKLLAIWVKACNDEQPIIFYKSCKQNFKFSTENEVKQLIALNRELFRPLTTKTLNLYKAHYTDHPDRFPKVLLNGEGENVAEVIDRLTIESGFTSQFRRLPNEDPSNNENLQFGINLIMKKWKIVAKSKEERYRSWAYIIVPIIALVSGALVSIFAVLHGK